jgi:hypothetical protein
MESENGSLFRDFSLAKDGKREWLSRLPARYRKAVGEYKDIEIIFTQITL